MKTSELESSSPFELTRILLANWQLDRLEFIGRFKAHPAGKGGWFDTLRHPHTLEVLELPFCYGIHRAYSPSTTDDGNIALENGKFYLIRAKISPRKKQENIINPFNLIAKAVKEVDNPAKQEVDEILKLEKDIGEVPAKGFARAIQQVINSMWSGPDRFIYELIQNADDLPAKRANKRFIHFRLLPNYLLFLHNGDSFEKSNVKAISDVGGSTKEGQAGTTGYKGVGFKSVYRDSSCVYINSGDYSFRYDKSSVENASVVPWHTWPLWTDEKDYPEEIKAYKDNAFFNKEKYPVAIALEVGATKIKSYEVLFKELFKDPKFTLFLRNLNFITVTGKSKEDLYVKIHREERREEGIVELSVDDVKESYVWLNYKVGVPFEVKQFLKNSSSLEHVKKLQDAEEIDLTFALKKNDENGEIEILKDTVVYSYLPTSDLSYGFPFLVNSDFITDASRQHVERDNLWNSFLFETIGSLTPTVIIDLIKKDINYASSVYKLIPEYYQEIKFDQKNQLAFNKGLENAVKTTPLIITASGKLSFLQDVVLDVAGLYDVLPNLYQNRLLKGKHLIHKLAFENLLQAKKSNKFEIEEIKISDVAKAIEETSLETDFCLADSINLLKHLFKYKESVLINCLIDIKWLFNQKGERFSPDFFSYQLENTDVLFPFLEEINWLHTTIADVVLSTSELREWFDSNYPSLLPLSKKAAVDKILLPKLKDGTVLQTESDSVIAYLYKLFEAGVVDWLGSLEERRKLMIPVRVENQTSAFAILRTCYLSDKYLPEYPFESLAELLTGNFNFIWSGYLSEVSREVVRAFFHELGAKNSPGTKLLQDELLPQLKQGTIAPEKHEALLNILLKDYAKKGANHYTELILSGLGSIQVRTEDNISRKATDCYLSSYYDETLKEVEVLGNLSDVVAPDYGLLTGLDSTRDFFKKIGVRSLSTAEAIDLILRKQLMSPFKSVNDSVEFVLTCLKLKEKNLLSGTHKQLLRTIPLFLKDKTSAPACCCYLGTEYNPQLNLEDITEVGEKRFLGPEYLFDGYSPEVLKAFLLEWFGVREKFEPKWYPEITRPEAELHPELQVYLKWVDDNKIYHERYSYYKKQHGILNLLFVNNLELVTNNKSSEMLVKALTAEWSGKPSYFPEAKYWVYGNKNQSFKFTPNINYKCFCFSSKASTSQELLPSTPRLAYRLKDQAPKHAWVAVYGLGNISLEKYFGLKTELDVNEVATSFVELCEELKDLPLSNENETKFIQSFERLIEYFDKSDGVNKFSNPKDVKAGLYLPASDNTWQPITSLFYLSEAKFYFAHRNDLIKRYTQLKEKQLINFLNYIEVTIINEKDFELAQEQSDLKSCSPEVIERMKNNRVLEIINYAKSHTVSEVLISKQIEKLEELSFTPAKSVTLTCSKIPSFTVPAEDRCQIIDSHFFFSGSLWESWRHFGMLGDFINEKLELETDARLLVDLLRAKNSSEIVQLLKESNWPIPDWFEAATLTPSLVAPLESDVSTTTLESGTESVVTRIEIPEIKSIDIEGLPEGDLDREAIESTSDEAVSKAVIWLNKQGYLLMSEPDINIYYDVKGPDDNIYSVVVKSAKGKLISINPNEYEALLPDYSFMLLISESGINKTNLDEILEDNIYRFARFHADEFTKERLGILAKEYCYSKTFQFRLYRPFYLQQPSVLTQKGDMVNSSTLSTEEFDI